MMVYSKVSFKLFFLMKETGQWDFSKMSQLIARYSEAQTGTAVIVLCCVLRSARLAYPPTAGCPVTYTYTFDEVRSLLKDWQIVELRKDHIFPWKIDEYKRYQYVKEDYWKVFPPPLAPSSWIILPGCLTCILTGRR